MKVQMAPTSWALRLPGCALRAFSLSTLWSPMIPSLNYLVGAPECEREDKTCAVLAPRKKEDTKGPELAMSCARSASLLLLGA